MPRKGRRAEQPPDHPSSAPSARHAWPDGRQCAEPATSPAPGGRQPPLPVSAPRCLKSRKRQRRLPGARHGCRPQVRVPGGWDGEAPRGRARPSPRPQSSPGRDRRWPRGGAQSCRPPATPAPLLAGHGSTLTREYLEQLSHLQWGDLLFILRFWGFCFVLGFVIVFFLTGDGGDGAGVSRTLPSFPVTKTKAK